MGAIFMNIENSKTSKPHVLILKLSDGLDFRKGEKNVVLSNLVITIYLNISSNMER